MCSRCALDPLVAGGDCWRSPGRIVCGRSGGAFSQRTRRQRCRKDSPQPCACAGGFALATLTLSVPTLRCAPVLGAASRSSMREAKRSLYAGASFRRQCGIRIDIGMADFQAIRARKIGSSFLRGTSSVRWRFAAGRRHGAGRETPPHRSAYDAAGFVQLVALAFN